MCFKGYLQRVKENKPPSIVIVLANITVLQNQAIQSNSLLRKGRLAKYNVPRAITITCIGWLLSIQMGKLSYFFQNCLLCAGQIRKQKYSTIKNHPSSKQSQSYVYKYHHAQKNNRHFSFQNPSTHFRFSIQIYIQCKYSNISVHTIEHLISPIFSNDLNPVQKYKMVSVESWVIHIM